MEEFARSLSPFEYKQYIFKIRDYLVPYLLDNKQGIRVENVFKEEFTRMDIINSAIYYVKENPNVESLSAIDDFLIATNRFFEELLFDKYPNPTLMKCKPFTQLSVEIQKRLLNENIELKPREVNPAINSEQYDFILSYLKNPKLSNAKIKKFKVSSIIIKMMLLFGFGYDLIIGLKIENYCIEKRTLRIEYKKVPKTLFYKSDRKGGGNYDFSAESPQIVQETHTWMCTLIRVPC